MKRKAHKLKKAARKAERTDNGQYHDGGPIWGQLAEGRRIEEARERKLASVENPGPPGIRALRMRRTRPARA